MFALLLLAMACTSTSDELLGSWEGCDGRVVEFTNGDPGDELETAYTIIGVWTALGGLGAYGFTEGELGYGVNDNGDGTYTGEVKWRSTGGSMSWEETTITVDGATWTDTGSDGCTETMSRVD